MPWSATFSILEIFHDMRNLLFVFSWYYDWPRHGSLQCLSREVSQSTASKKVSTNIVCSDCLSEVPEDLHSWTLPTLPSLLWHFLSSSFLSFNDAQLYFFKKRPRKKRGRPISPKRLSLVQDRWFFSLPCSATPLGHFCFPWAHGSRTAQCTETEIQMISSCQHTRGLA